jgi:hypothetical protein
MAKLRGYYAFDLFLRDRPAPRPFKCAQCGYCTAGTPPPCEVCAKGVSTQRCEADGQMDEERPAVAHQHLLTGTGQRVVSRHGTPCDFVI